MNDCPIVQLKNGLRVANFSSPHPFTFDDGTVLPACDSDRCNAMSLRVVEDEIVGARWTDISIHFHLTPLVIEELTRVASLPEIDIVLVPFPVLQCIQSHRCEQIVPTCWITKFRVIRTVDRVSKIISSSRFCI